MNAQENINNYWFKNGQCTFKNAHYWMFRRRIPLYIVEMFPIDEKSKKVLRICCARWFRLLLSLPILIAVLMAETMVWFPESNFYMFYELCYVVVSIIDIALIAGALLFGRDDIDRLSLILKDIIEVSRLSPETFPKTRGDFDYFVDAKVVDMARWILFFQEKEKFEEAGKVHVKLKKFFYAAKGLGAHLEDDYRPYFKRARKLLSTPVPAYIGK